MRKDVIKSLIAIKQSEIPFDVIERDIKLPINRNKIITVPGVRRCGKSTLMEIAINGLVREGVSPRNILWLGFDDERLKNGGSVLTVEYFDRLLEQIREIRLSERRFYQKITDIYATALDYDRTAKTTKQFFAKVQNKMHYAVHGHTAAELIYERADADKPHMGLTTWAAAPEGKIVKSDVSVAKNYLSEKEMRSLERIVSAYLDLAEDRAERHIPMTMEDWAKRLDLFLMADDREVLQDAGKITAEIAKAKAETEFEKYRVIQDRLFMSDFDKYMLELEKNAKK